MRFLTSVLLLFFCTIARADDNKLNLTFYGSFVHSTKVPNALFFFSDIESNDSFELRRALRNEDIDTVVLASSGGSVWEALSMAGVIFDRKMVTYVPELPNSKGCYSACSFMFFAGNERLVRGELGVHQVGAYDQEIDKQKIERGAAEQAAQFTTSEVIGFLNEFKTPPWVFERMFRSREMYIFSDSEKNELNVGQLSDELEDEINEFLSALLAEIEQDERKQAEDPPFEYLNIKDIDQVKSLQSALNSVKCSAGLVDGVWGRKTSYAAARFAKANGLPYSGTKSINLAYITKLAADDKQACPPLPKPKKTLAGDWSFNSVCNGRTIKGSAAIRRSGAQFSITYNNQLGGTYRGTIYPQGRTFGFILEQTNGGDVTRGAGEINAGMNSLRGKSRNCRFAGNRKS